MTISGKRKTILLVVISLSALLCVFAAAIQSGYENSPQDTRDSKGYTLGFGNPITWELCGILLKNANAAAIARVLGWYGGLFLLTHLLAILVLLLDFKRIKPKLAAACCWLQLVIFPSGWIGVLLFTFVVIAFFEGKIDGEQVSELPFGWTFQPLWFVASILAGIWFWQSSRRLAADAPKPSVALSS
jgi:drug/metabolite transporter superfamily protein YnfA